MIRVAIAAAFLSCKSEPPRAPVAAALRPYQVVAVDGLDNFMPFSLTVDHQRVLMAGFGNACLSDGLPKGALIAIRSLHIPELRTLHCSPSEAYFAIAPFTPHTLAIGGRGPNGALVRLIDEDTGSDIKTLFEGGAVDNSIIYGLASRTIFDGSVKLGVTGRLSGSERQLFVARYSATGTRDWLVSLKPDRSPLASHVSLERDGSVIFAGDFSGDVDIGGKHLRAVAHEEAFVAKIDSQGTVVWAHQARGRSVLRTLSVRDGVIVAAGRSMETISFGSTMSVRDPGAFVYVLTSDGTPRWLRAYDGGEEQSAIGAAIADDGSIDLVVNRYGGFGVRRLDKSGSPITAEWSATMTELSSAFVARSTAGELVVVGSYAGLFNAGNRALPAVPFGGFVVRLAPPLKPQLNGAVM